VEYGTAYFDYIPQDFKYVKQLHGMSTIQEWQLKDAMKKNFAVIQAKSRQS
jgi:ATP-dependent DNA helicase RecQ